VLLRCVCVQQLVGFCSELDSVERELNSVGFKDSATWSRLLSIVIDLLAQTHRHSLSEGDAVWRSMLEGIIIPGLASEHPGVQQLALQGLTAYVHLDRHEHLQALLQEMSGDAASVSSEKDGEEEEEEEEEQKEEEVEPKQSKAPASKRIPLATASISASQPSLQDVTPAEELQKGKSKKASAHTAAPSTSSRPSRAAATSARSAMAKQAVSQAKVDKILDAESSTSEEEEVEEAEEQENIKV
jgi:hypothetical protein